ncbi:MAG: acetyl-CoA carboxylase biotin carboxyl carrier protein subunit [Propionibacteriaceae bacterium]|nr:acetyl-CoA carboxylase biotin carboxyl carrier protein subunit [Propionibacteriaceae bacterium]
MPGVVLSIEVAPGAPVRHGQTLLVLEAMKMKNELKAPRDAIVADVLVAAGQQVKHGDPLIKFEQVQS